MKKPTLRIAIFDHPSVGKNIDARLRNLGGGTQIKKQPNYKGSDLINKQANYDLSFCDPTGKLKKIRNNWMADKCAEMGLDYFDLFSYFMSSVVVFPMTNPKEPLLVFKALRRVPGELRFSFQGGITHTYVCPFAIYWKGQFHRSWPLELISKFPAIVTPLFWQRLSKYPEINEIPLALTRSTVYGKSFTLINNTLRDLKFLSEGRGSTKEKSDYPKRYRSIVISEYERLCKESKKHRNRIPVDKLSKHLCDELEKTEHVGGKGDTIPHLDTIRRWIKEHDVEATRWNELQNAFDKNGVMTLPALRTVTAVLLVNLSAGKPLRSK